MQLHDNNIIHGDLKMENIMLTMYRDEFLEIKRAVRSLKLKEYTKSFLKNYIPKDFNTLEREKRKKIKKILLKRLVASKY